MTTQLALACGEVPWERSAIEAVEQQESLQLHRRYVDTASLVADARSGTLAPIVVMSPALRGFEERAIRALAASDVRLVIVLDSIRPPWLDGSGLDCRELAAIRWSSLLASLAADVPASTTPLPGDSGRITVFLGAGGGVGTTSLAWIAARASADRILLDAAERPSLAFLAGADASSNTLVTLVRRLREDGAVDPRSVAIDGRVLTLEPDAHLELSERDVDPLLDAVHAHGLHLVVDAGSLRGTGFAAALVARASTTVLVAAASPPGILALAHALPLPDDRTAVVLLNRFRDSLGRGARGRTAASGLVERVCGVRPYLVEDAVDAFDRAWLHGDWTSLADSVPALL